MKEKDDREEHMQVGQAIVSSIASKSRYQNEIVSRSNEIDDRLAKALCNWSPCRCQLAFGQSESYNYFHPDENTLAIARSTGGELENKRYGGRFVVSHVVVVDREQLKGYHDNIVLLARMLNSMGSLSLRLRIPNQLPSLELPDYSLPDPDDFERPELAAETQKILRAIDIHKQVVLLGLENPMPFLCSFLANVPTEQRLHISFATGLKLADERPFNLQFFYEADCALARELASRQLRTISLRPSQQAVF